jgi:two-component system chemotaxis sensor kinase CheA
VAIDLPRFAGSFHEEALGHLATMESLLLAVNIRRSDPEALDAIFRAAHSLQGRAGAFGHVALGDFARELEAAFDGLRKGEIAFTRSLIGVFLRSVDALRAHLTALRQGGDTDDAPLDAARHALTTVAAQARRICEGLDTPIASPAIAP